MKPEALVVAVGIPPEIESDYVQAFTTLQRAQNASLILSSKLHPRDGYTDAYAADLYDRLANKLKRRRLLCDTTDKKNLILLYLKRDDGSEVSLLDRFRVEALVTRLNIPDLANAPIRTRNQRKELINRLVRATRSAIRQARDLLTVIAEEVTSRGNKTCLLLPPKTFGKEFDRVFDRVCDAARTRKTPTEFRKILKFVSGSLRKSEGRYFEGRGHIVFKSPGKGRHGLAPSWGDGDHSSSCIIRGRLRFGAFYDPRFHYDCDLAKSARRHFPGCHRAEIVPRNRSYVNVAPNDNVRY